MNDITTMAPFGVIFFGVLLTAFSIQMMISPVRWSRLIVRFSEWRWFHPFEIVSRLIFGLIFVQAASLTRYPALVKGIGYLLIAVVVGLLLLRPSRHRHFARWSAEKFQAVFRPAGVVTALFGIFLVFVALK